MDVKPEPHLSDDALGAADVNALQLVILDLIQVLCRLVVKTAAEPGAPAVDICVDNVAKNNVVPDDPRDGRGSDAALKRHPYGTVLEKTDERHDKR